jgi:UDP-N-acetylmuramate-alanine ligase
MSLIPDVATIPYDNSFDILTALDKDNVNHFALLNSNQEVNAEPFDVVNRDGRFYFFLNKNNVVEYVGNEPYEEEIYVDDEMDINMENIDVGNEPYEEEIYVDDEMDINMENIDIVSEGFMNLNNNEDLMLIIIFILLLIFILC